MQYAYLWLDGNKHGVKNIATIPHNRRKPSNRSKSSEVQCAKHHRQPTMSTYVNDSNGSSKNSNDDDNINSNNNNINTLTSLTPLPRPRVHFLTFGSGSCSRSSIGACKSFLSSGLRGRIMVTASTIVLRI